LALLGIGSMLTLTFVQIPFPKQTTAVALIRSNLSPTINLPNTWDETLRTSHTPIIIGLASKADHFEPFAIIPRFQPAPGLQRVNRGLISLVSQNPLQNLEQERAISWILPLLKLTKHQAILAIHAYKEGEKVQTIKGPIDHNIWQTDIPLTAPNEALPDWPNAINFDALPQAWTGFNDALQHTQGWEIPDKPISFGWKTTDFNIQSFDFKFPTKVPSATAISLMGSFGLHDTINLALEDGSLIEEYQNPLQLFTQATSTSWKLSNDTQLTVEGQHLSVSNPTETEPIPVISCPGQPIARTTSHNLQPFLSAFNIEQAANFESLIASVKDDTLIVCLN